MDEFRAALGQYLIGAIEVADLELAIDQALESSADAGPQLTHMLDELYGSARLPHQIYAILKRRIERHHRQPSRTGVPDDEATRFQGPSSAPPAQSVEATRFMPSGGARPVPGSSPGTDSDTERADAAPSPASPQTGHTDPTQPTDPSSRSGTGGTGDPSQPSYREHPSQPSHASQSGYQSQPSRSGSSGAKWSHPSQWSGSGSDPGQVADIGTIIKGRFVLESVLGQGGMGKVFKARDLRKEEAQDRNPYIAVKILNEDFKRHPQALQALQRESRKAQDLAHPNIVTVFDFDRDGDTVFMTMEYLDGESLDKFNKRHDRRGIPVAKALELIEGLGRGLMHAHSRGVVHSDFKPANAFLTRTGGVKIFDFGIARAAHQKTDAEGEKTLFDAGELGALTPAYASCEMLEGGEPDPRDDVYALAVVAYELMAGRHPFAKKPAAKARDAGMQPQPIKGLSRRQWRALARGLAFARGERSPSVEAFLDGIMPHKLKSGQLAAAAVAVVAVVVSSALLLPGYLEQRQVDSLIDTITSGPDMAITARLDELRQLPAEQFRNVFVEESVQGEFVDYYLRRIRELWDPAAERYRYQQAQPLIAELGELFPDSRSVGELEEQLQEERDNKIADLYQDLDRLREAGQLVPQQGDDNVLEVLASIRQIDSDDPRLSDGSIPIRFAEVGGELLEQGDTELASTVVDQGLALAAADVSLINLRDRIQNQLARQQREERIAELENVITERLASSNYGDDLELMRTSMLELASLDAGNAALAQARSRIDGIIDSELETLVDAREFDAGRNLLDRFSGVASADFIATQRSELENQAGSYRDRVDRLLEDLDSAIAQGRLDGGSESATSVLERLAEAGISEQQIFDARGRTAEAYASRALRARNEGRWDSAREALAAGLALDPPPSVAQRLEEDVELVDIYQTRAEQSAASEREEMLAQARREEIQRLLGSFQSRLEADEFSTSDARGALSDLRSLEDYDAAPDDGRNLVAERLQARVQRLANAGEFEPATQLAEQSIALLPDHAGLRALRQRVQADYQAQVASQQQDEVSDVAGRLDSLIASARLDQGWNEQVRGLLNRYAGMIGQNHPAVVDMSQRVAELFVRDARRLRVEERYENAVQQLDRAAAYAPQLTIIEQERSALAEDRRALQQQLAARSREAEIERLKNNLRAEAARGNAAGATDILDELREMEPDDPFVQRDGPRTIARAYAELARKEVEGGEFERARSLVSLGRSHAPDLPELGEVEQAIGEAASSGDRRTIASIGDVLAGDQPLNAQAIAAAVADIRSRNPQLLTQMEPKLVDAMVAKIQRLSSSDSAAAARRLQVAQTVFPGNARLAGYRLPQVTSSADPCVNPSLIGNGNNRRASCRDELSENRQGPPLVVIPSGGPLSRPVAISKYEITISDYNAYCELSGACSPINGDRTLPVTGISIQQAQAFVDWLAETSGARYRLPSSEEWEYAANAAGQQPPRDFNCEVRQNNVPIKGMSLQPVNSGDANGWGLKNYVGNAQEWVKGPNGWEVRGGAHTTSMTQCDIRLGASHSGEPDSVTGFRVLRELG